MIDDTNAMKALGLFDNTFSAIAPITHTDHTDNHTDHTDAALA